MPEQDRIAENLAKRAKNAIRIHPTDIPADPLASRFGGNPMLPPDFPWCTYEGETWDGIRARRPLAFLCQINCADCAPYDTEHLLPDHGILALFYEVASMRWGYDPADLGCARVFWFEDTSSLMETAPPCPILDMNEDEVILPTMGIAFTAETTVPSTVEYESDWRFWTEENLVAYEAVAVARGANPAEEPSRLYRLLGHAATIQGDVRHDCVFTSHGYYLGDGQYREQLSEAEYATIQAEMDDWVLLCQLGSTPSPDGTPRLEWGDMGAIYFLIRRDDLAARDFSRVRLVLQCG